MSIVLITGSSGLIGSESVSFFCKKGFKVIGIDNNLREFFFGKNASTFLIEKSLKKKYKNFSSFDCDIRNINFLEKKFKKYKNNISLIIHCAAQPSHDYAKNHLNLDFDINAKGTSILLELTKKYCSNSPFIFMSTNKVYGDNPNKLDFVEKKKRWELAKNSKYFNGIDESFSIDNAVHSFFGVSKIYADILVQEYGRNIGLKTVCFRAGCLTGPNHQGAMLHGFLSYLVKKSLTTKSYELIGHKGKQVRDNLHSSDLVNCFWEFYKKPKNGEVYNIGGGRFSNCSIIEALDKVEEMAKIKIKKKFIKQPRIGDHIWYISNIEKFKKNYPNWKQKYNTKKIIEELVKSYK
jgi:CDP-paratose 2-epimerase